MQTLMAVISETVVMVPRPSTAEKHSRGGNQEPWKTSKHPDKKEQRQRGRRRSGNPSETMKIQVEESKPRRQGTPEERRREK